MTNHLADRSQRAIIMQRIFLVLCLVWVGVRALAMAGRWVGQPWAIGLASVDNFLGWAVPPAAIAATLLWRPKNGRQATLPTLVVGWVIAATFLMFDVGKALHTAEMLAFFRDSGWPGWMHWIVLCTEVVAALVMVAAPTSRAASAASLLLSVVMAGAILTHARNGDPWTASADALRQALFLGCYQALNPIFSDLQRQSRPRDA